MASLSTPDPLENNSVPNSPTNDLETASLATVHSTSPPPPPRSSLMARFFSKPSTSVEQDFIEDQSSLASSDSEAEESWVLAGKKEMDELSGGGGDKAVEEAKVEEVSVQRFYSHPLPNGLDLEMDIFTSNVEHKLRVQSSLQQSFEMSIDERFASLKEEIKEQIVKDMRVLANEEIKTALALNQKSFNVQLESVRSSNAKQIQNLEATIKSLVSQKTHPSNELSTPRIPSNQTIPLESPSPLFLANSSPQSDAKPKTKIVHTIPPSVPHTLSEQLTSLLLCHSPSLLSTSLTHPQAHHLAAFTLVTSILDLPLFIQPLLADDASNSTEPLKIVVQAFFQEAIYSKPELMDRWANLFQTLVDQLAPRLGEKRKFVVRFKGGPLVLDGVGVGKLFLEQECQAAFNDRDAPFPSHHYLERLIPETGTDPLIPLIAQLFVSEPEQLVSEEFVERVAAHLARDVSSNPSSDVQALWELLRSGVGARLEKAGALWSIWTGVEERKGRWEEFRVVDVGEERKWMKGCEEMVSVMESGREVKIPERQRGIPEKLIRLRSSGCSRELPLQMSAQLKPVKMMRLEAAGEW